jgi:hypothetical protein
MSVQTSTAEAAETRKSAKKKVGPPWLAFLCLFATIVIFWILPFVIKHTGPVQVEFDQSSK